MTAKRYRTRAPREGELIAYYGKAEGVGPDVCYWAGAGCERADARLLHLRLSGKWLTNDFPAGNVVLDKSLFEELQARGYDLTTLKFSIRKTAR